MNENVAFTQKVSDLVKALSAANDIFNTMEERLKNINLAIQDMPSPGKELLEKAHALRNELLQIELKLSGDQARARREYETAPAINDRVYGIEYSIWKSTAKVPKMYEESYAVASKEFVTVLANMKKAHSNIEVLERELELKNAPYTPGRWPEWSGN
jgi:uncharacterized protein involved in exopolysaccharide biosynthesis